MCISFSGGASFTPALVLRRWTWPQSRTVESPRYGSPTRTLFLCRRQPIMEHNRRACVSPSTTTRMKPCFFYLVSFFCVTHFCWLGGQQLVWPCERRPGTRPPSTRKKVSLSSSSYCLHANAKGRFGLPLDPIRNSDCGTEWPAIASACVAGASCLTCG